jgi:hypothetical protein
MALRIPPSTVCQIPLSLCIFPELKHALFLIFSYYQTHFNADELAFDTIRDNKIPYARTLLATATMLHGRCTAIGHTLRDRHVSPFNGQQYDS